MNSPENRCIENPFSSAPVVATPMGAAGQALVVRESTHIQAAMLLAQQFPRDEAKATDRILVACTRLSLAEEATYTFARGGVEITGPTIRLAEEVRRHWGNLMSGWDEVHRGDGRSEIETYCWDLESRSCERRKVIVRHWRDTREGGYALRDERDIYELNANQAARRERACILANIPGDVIAAALKQCELTLQTKAEVTPERLRTMIDRFAAYQVTREMIERRIQRHLDAITPAGLLQLGKVYNALRDGLAKVSDYFDVSRPASSSVSESVPESQTERAKQVLRARREVDSRARRGVGKVESGEAPDGQEDSESGDGVNDPMQSAIALHSTESAVAAIKACTTPEALTTCLQAIATDYREAGREWAPVVAIEALRACRSTSAIAEMWKGLSKEFRDAGQGMPLEVEAIFHECSEVLKQEESQ